MRLASIRIGALRSIGESADPTPGTTQRGGGKMPLLPPDSCSAGARQFARVEADGLIVVVFVDRVFGVILPPPAGAVDRVPQEPEKP